MPDRKTIYTGDDSITEGRTVNLQGFPLTFSATNGCALMINKAAFISELVASDRTAITVLTLRGDVVGEDVSFLLEAYNSSGGDVVLVGDANLQTIRFTAPNGVGINGAPVRSPFHISGLQNCADNDSAITAGLAAGDFYHTSGTVKVVI